MSKDFNSDKHIITEADINELYPKIRTKLILFGYSYFPDRGQVESEILKIIGKILNRKKPFFIENKNKAKFLKKYIRKCIGRSLAKKRKKLVETLPILDKDLKDGDSLNNLIGDKKITKRKSAELLSAIKERLSSRDCKILLDYCGGVEAKETACEHDLAIDTVYKTRKRIFTKIENCEKIQSYKSFVLGNKNVMPYLKNLFFIENYIE